MGGGGEKEKPYFVVDANIKDETKTASLFCRFGVSFVMELSAGVRRRECSPAIKCIPLWGQTGTQEAG